MQRTEWFLLLIFTLIVTIFWVVLPDMVVVFNDDFGYVRSVVATLQHRIPWTDDWLEPWVASLSLVSGLIFKITGSFYLATQGVQAAMAGLSFWALAILFARRAVPLGVSIVAAAVVLFVPTLMVKWLEYTALILYVPCLLWAVSLAEKQRWIGFFFVWVVAVASRQSALAWLALPAIAALSSLRSGTGGNRNRVVVPLAICLAGVAVYWLISRSMNETHAQHVMTTAMWRGLSFEPIVKHLALCVGIFFVCVGCAAFVVRAFCPRSEGLLSKERGGYRGVRVAAAVVVIGLFCLDPRTFVVFEHSFYAEGSGRLFIGIFFGLGAAGWLMGGFRLQPGHVVCAIGCSLLASLRGIIYDYYLIDVALIGLFSVLPANVSSESGKHAVFSSRSILAILGAIACMAIAGFEFVFLGKEQRILDRYTAVIRLCEPALRAGRISPTELAVGPFGYYGWHLYPYFIRHDGVNGAYIGDFEYYLNRNSLAVTFTSCSGDLQTQAALVRDARGQGDVVDSGVFKIGFRGPFLFVLRRTGQPSEAKLHFDPSQYRLEPFPLNDAEWRQLIAGSELR
jgi:hypothetical protein